MDSKRPDVRLDDDPDEDGRVTDRDADSDDSNGPNQASSRSLLETIRSSLR